MLALLLTMLFTLYPPQPATGNDKSAGLGTTASYVSQNVKPAEASTNIAIAAAAGLAAPVKSPAAVALNPPLKAGAGNPATAAPKGSPAPLTPKTASLSLVTADATAKPNDVGIDNAIIGKLYSGSIQVDGFKLPLPPGNWIRLAMTSIKIPTATGAGFFLAKIEHKHLIAAVKGYVVKSKDNPGAGFPEAKGCSQPDPTRNFVSVEGVTPFDSEACWLIHSYYTTPWQQWADRSLKIDLIDRAAAGDLSAKGVTYPQDLVDVRFIRFEKWGGMEVHYLFSPEAEGISSNTVLSYSDMDWRANNIVRYPEKMAYVDKLKAWGASFWPQFKAGFAQAAPVAEANEVSQKNALQ